MREKVFLVLALFLASAALADDADDAGAKLHEYFEAFSAKDIRRIVNDVYSAPVHIGGGTAHRILATAEDAAANLARLYEQIEAQGWVESRIHDLKVCVAAESLALVDTRYSRIKANGEAIPPEIRTTLYVVQKLDGDWRIVAFYSHDNERRPHCG